MLEILRVRSVGAQLLLTTGSRSICTYEAESRRGAEVSFHWESGNRNCLFARYTFDEIICSRIERSHFTTPSRLVFDKVPSNSICTAGRKEGKGRYY